MLERLPLNRNPQFTHVGKIRLAQLPWSMLLGKIDLLAWPFKCSPLPYLPLKCTKLSIHISARILPLQPLKQCLGLQAMNMFQFLLNLVPDVFKGIFPGLPVPFSFVLAR